jgi:uncharacterized protein (TIGR03437 family)
VFQVAGYSQVSVLTANYDNDRSNADVSETQLTPSTVAPGSFGKLGTLPVDGQVFAQPLYVASLYIPGQGVRNVVYVATEHNSVYAYDADTVASPVLYWHVNLGPSVPSNALQSGYTDVSPEVGILSTGVIDAASGVLYVVVDTFPNGAPVFQLHALDLVTGAERMNGPVTITAAIAGIGVGSDGQGNLPFDPTMHIQRTGLLLSNGTVYIGFGSHSDYGLWHGWILGYNAANLPQQVGVFNTTPNAQGGSVWQSGRGLAADQTGALYFISGNGNYDGVTAYGETLTKMAGDSFQIVDWYTPGNADWLSNNDYDLSAGVALIPSTHTAIAGDKYGDLYVVNGDTMGHQDVNGTSQFDLGDGDFGIFTFAVWSRSDGVYVYLQQQWGPLASYLYSSSGFSMTPASTSGATAVTAYGGMTVSANGGQPGSGILWEITRDTADSSVPGTLHAFTASNLSIELWNSGMVAGDSLGTFPKFVSPTVANGKVYAPNFAGAVVVYGLLSSVPGGQAPPVIAGIASAASYASNAVSPGELVTVLGAGLGPATPAGLTLDSSGSVNTDVAGATVLFDGNPAAVIYAASGQVNAVVPYELANPTTQVQVEYHGVPSSSFPVTVVAATPGVFTADSSGSGQACALNQDGSVNSNANPAPAGTVVVLYATGGGQTSPAGVDGSVTGSAPLPQLVLPVTVLIGGQPATVLYAGGAPETVAGVLQINAQIPAAAPPGPAVPVTLKIGGQTSPQSVTIAVQ